MAENKLVLHPVDPWAILHDPSLLLDALKQRGLVGASFSHFGELHYRAGSQFAELVSFRSGPPGAAAFHVSLLETTTDPTFLGGANTQAPLCPGCRGRFADWRTQLTEWQQAPDRHSHHWTCRTCGRRVPVASLDWQRTGGIARYALDLWGVRENEAMPSPALVEALRTATAAEWTYFYYRL